MYFLLSVCEREIGTPVLFDSLEEARHGMKMALISAMDGLDDSIFNEYGEDDYWWSQEGDSAWFNHRHGNSDWRIVSMEEIEDWTNRLRQADAN